MNYAMPMTQGRKLPKIYIREIDLPEVRTMKIGDQIYVVCKLELISQQSGKSMYMDNGNDSSKIEGELEMLSIKKLTDEVSEKSLKSGEYNEMLVKVKSGQM